MSGRSVQRRDGNLQAFGKSYMISVRWMTGPSASSTSPLGTIFIRRLCSLFMIVSKVCDSLLSCFNCVLDELLQTLCVVVSSDAIFPASECGFNYIVTFIYCVYFVSRLRCTNLYFISILVSYWKK